MIHYKITIKSLPFDKLDAKCNSHSPQGQMLESAVNMSAYASPRDNPMSARQPQVVSNGHRSIMSSSSLIAPSTISLAMMREAFKGLLADTEMSFSSAAEQRDVLERSTGKISRLEATTVAVSGETHSRGSVVDSEQIRDAANSSVSHNASLTQANDSNSLFAAASSCQPIGETR
jgi:hypothetical protein